MKITVLPALFVLAFLAGCGIKPANVSAPDPGKDNFPRVYPDPATDPQLPERQIRR